MLTGQRLYLTGVVRDAGEVIQVPLEKLRELVAEDKAHERPHPGRVHGPARRS